MIIDPHAKPPIHKKPAPVGESVREYLERGGEIYYAKIGESGETFGTIRPKKAKEGFIPRPLNKNRKGWQ